MTLFSDEGQDSSNKGLYMDSRDTRVQTPLHQPRLSSKIFNKNEVQS